jgi:hypothetical protein
MTTERELSTADIASGADQQVDDGRREQIPEQMRAGSDSSDMTPLLDEGRSGDLRTRWGEIQTNFVDDPRTAVQQADSLVAETMKTLAETFSTERQNLETQWSRGEEASTEDLRLALQRYRSFFNRLLSV